jgi:Fe-S cluster assembly ATP-binding protein
MPLLEVKNLQVEVDGKKILNGLDLNVDAGQVHAIMGPNGSGKSTFSYVLAGKENYHVIGGSVRFEGKDLLALKPDERAASLKSRPPISCASYAKRPPPCTSIRTC